MFERLGRIFGKDRATGSAAVSGFDTEEQLGEEPDDEEPTMDDYFMSSKPTATGPADTLGNAGQGTASSVDRAASTRRITGKKRKQADILERMADEVHESTAAQREHVQILANAISGKNDEVKMGEKLAELGFADHDAIQVVCLCYHALLHGLSQDLDDDINVEHMKNAGSFVPWVVGMLRILVVFLPAVILFHHNSE
ncbi:hypothetical protein PIB30_059956 [Stylosanthes scabra]|uniref:Uncharacterized protein n=1 Tax=Stylosanthes scabra TaxID=79078 RepID=A0ABU6RKT0_9FABA|nr:hypothetical protein [Stylosanthes scabra]